MSNYASRAVDALNEHPTTAGNPPELQHLYAQLVLTRGTAVTTEDVHDAWSLWRCTTRPDHPDLVPFVLLSPEAQAKDEPYRDAIADVARRWLSADLAAAITWFRENPDRQDALLDQAARSVSSVCAVTIIRAVLAGELRG